MNRVIINIGIEIYILNSINSIMRFLERRDYTYWTHKIHSKFKRYTHLSKFNHAVPLTM